MKGIGNVSVLVLQLPVNLQLFPKKTDTVRERTDAWRADMRGQGHAWQGSEKLERCVASRFVPPSSRLYQIRHLREGVNSGKEERVGSDQGPALPGAGCDR